MNGINNEELSIREMQEIEFNILKFLKEICDANGLNYYLAYGTLIGTVRSNNFIPWDDDIDIQMPREDYLKLVKIFENDPHPYYKLVSAETDKEFTAPLPKIIDSRIIIDQDYGFIEKVPLGPYVDIFILDGAGDNYKDAINKYSCAYKLYKAWFYADLKLSGLNLTSLKSLFFKLFGIKFWLNKLDKFSSNLSFYSAQYVSVLCAGTKNPKRNVWEYNDFGKGIEKEFHGIKFRIPNNYDYILRSEYGEYMKLPEKEKRVSHHKYKVYFTSKTQDLFNEIKNAK